MIFIIEGLQNVGKTSLIKTLPYKHYRFPFNEYLSEFDLGSSLELNAFQIAKDLGILFGLNLVDSEDPILLDRGPISTIYYSIKEGRVLYTNFKITSFIKELSKFSNIHYIFVSKINDEQKIQRSHNDNFDYLDDDNDELKDKYLERLVGYLKDSGLKISYFENDFSKSIGENARRLYALIEGVNYEH